MSTIEYEIVNEIPPTNRDRRGRWSVAKDLARQHPGQVLRFPAKKNTQATKVVNGDQDVEVFKRRVGDDWFIYIVANGEN